MATFLRHSYNIPTNRWGSDADIRYALKENCEKIFGINYENLVLAMPMFNQTWNRLKDYSNSKNDGVPHGGNWTQLGLTLDGTDDYVDLGISGGNLIEGTAYTLTINFHPYTWAQNYEGVITKDQNSPWSFSLRKSGVTGGIQWEMNGSSLQLGNIWEAWDYIITLAFDASTGREGYVNGVLANSDAYKTQVTSNNDFLFIGTDYWFDTARHFDGHIKGVSIFDVALTPDQIALLNDLPYALYQPISRPIYFSIPARHIKALADTINLSDAEINILISPLCAFAAANKTFNFNAKSKDFNFNASLKTFNFTARIKP
ncbi:MAG: LamG domain-containing protein [Deltaproteobacteria bacterium]|nr:LamG domain-containing protein [Deltaproteobacteria bacterium]